MKKHLLVLASTIALGITGCAANTPAPADNSAEIESLKAQIDELEKENEALKAQAETVVETTVAETTEAETAAPANDVIQLGEEGTLADWGISVSSAEFVDSIAASYGSFSPDEGNKYLVATVTITNNGKTADSFISSYSMGDDVVSKILYGDGYVFSATNLLGHDKSLHDQVLNPLSSKNGQIAFEIPDSVVSATDELILQFRAGNQELNVKVR